MSDQPTDNVRSVCDWCDEEYAIETSDADQRQFYCSHECEYEDAMRDDEGYDDCDEYDDGDSELEPEF